MCTRAKGKGRSAPERRGALRREAAGYPICNMQYIT